MIFDHRKTGEALEKQVVVMLPTYNEAENIAALLGEILALGPGFKAVVVDDNSPDGTAELARKAGGDRARVIVNPERKGRGTSGAQGFQEALSMGADYVVEMDAASQRGKRVRRTCATRHAGGYAALGATAPSRRTAHLGPRRPCASRTNGG